MCCVWLAAGEMGTKLRAVSNSCRHTTAPPRRRTRWLPARPAGVVIGVVMQPIIWGHFRRLRPFVIQRRHTLPARPATSLCDTQARLLGAGAQGFFQLDVNILVPVTLLGAAKRCILRAAREPRTYVVSPSVRPSSTRPSCRAAESVNRHLCRPAGRTDGPYKAKWGS